MSWQEAVRIEFAQVVKTDKRFGDIFVASGIADIKLTSEAIVKTLTDGISGLHVYLKELRADLIDVIIEADNKQTATFKSLLQEALAQAAQSGAAGEVVESFVQIIRTQNPEVRTHEQAREELVRLLGELRKAREICATPVGNPVVRKAFDEIKALTDQGLMSRLAAVGEAAFAEAEKAEASRRQEAEKELGLLLEWNISNSILEQKFCLAADWIERKLDRANSGRPVGGLDLSHEAELWFAQGKAHAATIDLQVALALYGKALRSVEDDWRLEGEILTSLANTQLAIGEKNGQESRLLSAIALYGELLSNPRVRVDEIAVSSTHHNLGVAYSLLASVKREVPAADLGISYLKESLKVRKKRLFPTEWAITQTAFGDLHILRGDLTGSPVDINVGIRALKDAISVRTREISPEGWAKVQRRLGAAYERQSILTGKLFFAWDAIEALELCFTVWTREQAPYQWAVAKEALGVAQMRVGLMTGSLDQLHTARDSMSSALEVLTCEGAPVMWGSVQRNLREVNFEIGRITRDPSTM